MKKNLYFRTVLRRPNVLKEALSDFFLAAFSLPRLSLEVFIKRNFGMRYFSSSVAIWNIIILLFLPAPVYAFNRKLDAVMQSGYGDYSDFSFWPHYATWYLFTAAFAYFANKRRLEIKRQPNVFDFAKFSLYEGDLDPAVAGLYRALTGDVRKRNIIFEPLPFLVAGIILAICSQPIGYMLILASLMYAGSFAAQYHRGDEFVMDKIDEMIMNEEKEDAFVDGKDASETRGVRFYAKRPTSEELKRKVADAMVEQEDDDVPEAR